MKFSLLLIFTLTIGGMGGFLAHRWQHREITGTETHRSVIIANDEAKRPLAGAISLTRLHAELTQGHPDYARALNEAAARHDFGLGKLLITQYAERDPAAAYQWYLALRAKEGGGSWYSWDRLIATIWSSQDPFAAIRGMLKHCGTNTVPAWTIFHESQQRDPAVAQQLLEQFPDAFAKANDLGAEMIIAASDGIAAMAPGSARDTCAQDLMNQWLSASEEDGRKALEFLVSLGPEIIQAVQPSIIDKFERDDLTAGAFTPTTVAAIEAALSSHPTLLREFRWNYLMALTSTDPAAALASADVKLTGSARTHVREQAFEAMANKDPEATWQLALDLPAGRDRESIIGSISNAMYQAEQTRGESSSVSLAWVLAMPRNDPARRHALASLAYSWMGRDPVALANHIRSAGPGELSESFFQQAGTYVPTTTDPVPLLQAIAANPALTGTEATCHSLATRLAQSNPERSQELIRSLPSGPPRTALVSSLADKLWRTDPEAALTFAQTLSPIDQATILTSLQAIGFPAAEAEIYSQRLRPNPETSP